MPAKPFILSIETSCRAGSVAIAAGPDLLAKADFSGPMRHSAELFPAIHSLLQGQRRKPKDIEHIYISVGPGSFTGIRIAVALAKAMNLANAVKIVAVDTLDVIAANATDYIRKHNTNIDKIAAVLDAKRGQFFIAAYQRKRKEPQATSNGAAPMVACKLSRDHDDLPGEAHLTEQTSAVFEGIECGVYYFHARVRPSGKWGPVYSKQICVDEPIVAAAQGDRVGRVLP